LPRAQLVAVALLLVGGLFVTFIVAPRVAEKRRPFVVQVDSNHRERYSAGRFATVDEAIGACRRIVAEDLEAKARANPGISAERLFGLWVAYSDRPFVVGWGWSARDYANTRCEKLGRRGF
jgi:hypothetical protein